MIFCISVKSVVISFSISNFICLNQLYFYVLTFPSLFVFMSKLYSFCPLILLQKYLLKYISINSYPNVRWHLFNIFTYRENFHLHLICIKITYFIFVNVISFQQEETTFLWTSIFNRRYLVDRNSLSFLFGLLWGQALSHVCTLSSSLCPRVSLELSVPEASVYTC